MANIMARIRELKRTGLGVMECCETVAGEMGRPKSTIYQVVRRFEPTTDIAEAYLKSSALRLAIRTVRDANVDQSIDVLSRKNIGVLAPKSEGEGGGMGGFFLSVNAESCGAVKVGVMAAQPQLEAPRPQLVTTKEVIDVEPEEVAPVSRPLQGHIRKGLSDEHKKAIQSARERVQAAQRKRGRERRAGRTVQAQAQPSQNRGQDEGAASE